MSSSSSDRPSLSKRSSARARTISGSESESSCSRSGNSAIVLTAAATAEPENISSASISPDQLKRKKRKKYDDFSNSEDKLRRRVFESGRCKKLELEMFSKAKLKVLVVQLVRLEDERRLQQKQEQQQKQQREQQQQLEQPQKQQPVAVVTQPKFEEIRSHPEEHEKRSKKLDDKKVELEKRNKKLEEKRVEPEKRSKKLEEKKVEPEKRSKKVEEEKIEPEKRNKKVEEEKVEPEKRNKKVEEEKVEPEKRSKRVEEEKVESEKKSKKVDEEKIEDRLRLSGLTLPAEVDPRILQQQLVVKINKHLTEKLLQDKRLQLQTTVDVSECADKPTEKLTNIDLSNCSNKCTKNANFSSSNSGKRVARISVDKSNNDRLPDRLLKDVSKCTADSATPTETSVSESQPESSKSFVNSCRRQKRNSFDQRSSDKQFTDLFEDRPKCPKEAGERHPESLAKDAKRYLKNTNKDVDKQPSVLVNGDIKKNDDEKHQPELPCDKSNKVSKNSIENHPRPRRNLVSKNSEKHSNELLENNQSDKSLAKNEKVSQNGDKSIQDSSISQNDSHKKITRKATEKLEGHVASAIDSKIDDGKKLTEEHSRKSSKRTDRKIECSKNETDNSKKVTKKADDKHDKSNGNITESCVNYVAKFVDAPKKLPDKLIKGVKVRIKNQIENITKMKKIDDAKSDKLNENDIKNESNSTQNITKESNKQSQNVHNNIQFSKISSETIETVQKTSQEITKIGDESTRQHSKNSDKKIIKTKTIDIDDKKQNKINIINNSNEKIVNNSTNNHSQDSTNTEDQNKNNSHVGKEIKKVPEINQRPKRRLTAKAHEEVNTEVITENSKDCKEDSVDKTNERLTKNLNTTVAECKTNIEIRTRRTKRLSEKKDDHSEILLGNNLHHAQQPHANKEEIPEKFNLEENTKSQTESIKRVKRKNTLEIAQNSVEENQRVLPDKSCKLLKNVFKDQTEIKSATTSSNLKQDQVTENSIENNSDTIEKIELYNAVKVSSNTDKINSNLSDGTNSLPRRKRGRPRKVLPNLPLTNAEVFKKNDSDSTQQSLMEKQDHCSKISNENKAITRKSLPSKHEKPIMRIVKHYSMNSHKTIEKNKEQFPLPEESQEIVRVCSKSQTENQKRVTRKSSSDKHERQTENESQKVYECAQNAISKTNQKSSEKTQRKIKECLKIQTEDLKRVTRKSVPDNHEQNAENLTLNSVDIAQNVTNDINQILSEKLDNKENSKNQIEINPKITRSSLIKRDRQSKNLMENNIDCVQTLADENKDKTSENLISSVKVLPNAKKLRKSSIDKANETGMEVLVENDIISVHNLVEENLDNFSKSEDIIENKKETKRNYISNPVQNTENNLPDQHSTNSIDGEQLVSTVENNLDSINVMECVENEKQLLVDENTKDCSNSLIDSTFPRSIIEDILSHAERLIASKGMIKESVADVEKEPKIDLEIRTEESVKKYVNDQSLDERYQNEIENIAQNHKELIDNNSKSRSVDHQDSIHCANIILEELFDISTNPSELYTEESYKSTENLRLEIDESTRLTANELTEDSCENLDAQNGMNSFESVEGDTNAICSEDFDEVIKYFCIPANQKFKDNSEDLQNDATSIENPAANISDQYENLKENIDDISELTTSVESHINDSVVDEYINSSLEKTDESLKVKETENVYPESMEPKDIVDASEVQVKSINISSTSLDNNHTEILPVHGRETTLLELRKKCTENLERRRCASHKNFVNSPIYPVLPLEDCGDLESDKSSTSSTNSSDENGTESDEDNYPDSIDSDENLADRLAHLRSLEIPPLHSSDDADSGVQTTSEEHLQEKRIQKIVLRCPRGSYVGINAITATAKLEFDCKDCDESFISNRELKKHIKVQHRQRLVIKIRKTDENKHAAHIVEQPVAKRLSKEQEDDEEDEGNASASPEKLDEDELVRAHDDERITEGDIKIIVRKEGGSKNSHVIKEIKITPKSNSDGGCSTRISSSSPARSDFGSGCSSSRIPGSSPARSDLGSSIGGGNSCRMPGNTPPRFDITPITNPVKRGRGRPRKYPIFTEAELIAKHLGTPANPQVNNGAPSPRKKKDESPFIVEGIFGKRNENEPLFEAVESIVIEPDFLFDSPQNKPSAAIEDQVENRMIVKSPKIEDIPSVRPTIIEKTEIVVSPAKRKRGRALSQESMISAKAEAAAIVHEEKKRKISEHGVETERMASRKEPKISQMPERSLSEPDLRAKYHITKELVVQLTKIDTVPNNNEDDNTDNQVDKDAKPTEASNEGEAESSVSTGDMPQKRTKPKIIVNELVELGNSSTPDFRAVLRLNLKRKLESNNNNLVVNNIDKCLSPIINGSPKYVAEPAKTTSVDKSNAIEESTSMDIETAPQVDEIQSQSGLQVSPEPEPHVQPEPQHQKQLQLVEMPNKTSTSKNSCGDCNCEFHIDDDFDMFEDNQTLVSESEQRVVATSQPPTIGRAEMDEARKAKLHMLMNVRSPRESANSAVSSVDPTSISQPLRQSQVHTQPQQQSQVQFQLQVQPQLPPLIHHQAPYQPHQIRPQVQQSPQAQIQLPSQVPAPPLTQIQVPPHSQVPLPSQTQIQLSSHSQLLQLQQATEGIQAQLQLPPQAQLVQLNQSQQFCILFFPESDGSNPAKDRPPTATIVNFQPVPDNEIANKPLIFMPTTPTKISIDDHAKQYVCATCSQVLDIIGRLEASLGMTEEDKSVIKCPYCSNHFQSLFYLEYHMMQEHLKCQNEKQCRHASFSNLRIPTHEAPSEFEIYITFALKCRSCYDIFNTVLQLNDHVMHKHKTLVRLKPPSLPFPNINTVGPAFPPGSPFSRRNGGPPHVAVLQCPSDCVCRIGIRSTDSPLQRQQMLKRCPNAMRRLEKIEPAAYEVYTCTLCKSTFLMKDEVVDHLMKMHEVSCKFPCYTCLTSFRTLQIQENHCCSETTLQDLDKLLSIAILPVNVGGSGKDDRSKYLEREDSSTDEYRTIKTAAGAAGNTAPSTPIKPPLSNGYKRKNGESVGALHSFLTINAIKRSKLTAEQMTTIQIASYRRRRVCPKCKLKYSTRGALQDHVIRDHLLRGDAREGSKKIGIDLLRILTADFTGDQNTNEMDEILKRFNEEDRKAVKSIIALIEKDEEENWDESFDKDYTKDLHITYCSNCKSKITMPATPDNDVKQNKHHQSSMMLDKPVLCEGCENGGPITRRRTIVNNGHHTSNMMIDTEGHRVPLIHQYTCKKCPESFPSLMELKFHKRSVHNAICNVCKRSFVSMRMVEKHKKNHHECNLDNSSKPITEDDNTNSSQVVSDCSKDNSEVNDSLNDKANSTRRDSSDSSSGTSKEPEEQPLNCSFCEEVCSSKVSLKNHLKREHGRRASICQFCNGLLIDTSEVRHMLDYHIVPSKSSSRSILAKSNGTILHCEASCMQDDVEELVRTLGKHRLQSLMMYHDFEGKCNNAIMRCPMCPEQFATRESCRFHYVWIHDDTCLLCDETFRSGSSAFQHKVDAHTSTASYLWCIQRLVTAIVYTLRLDPDQPSHVLYQILAMRIENEGAVAFQAEQITVRGASGTVEKTGTEEPATDNERFGLEAVVLSEDQLPDSSNIIEVVIGKEDSEDDLLSMLNLSPSYESCSEQHRLPNAGTVPPEEEEDEETVAAAAVAAMAVSSVPSTPILSSTVTSAATTPAGPTTVTTSPVVDNYVTSGVCKYRLENDEEQLVLVVTDEDLITFRDDIGSLAERISATCDSLTLDEITEMLRAYFDSVNGVTSSGAGA